MSNELYHHGVIGMKWGQRRSARNERNLRSKANQEKFGRREDEVMDKLIKTVHQESRDKKLARQQSRARMKSEGVGLISRYAKSFKSNEVKKVKGAYAKKYDSLEKEYDRHESAYKRGEARIKSEYQREIDRIRGREAVSKRIGKRK